jgi:Domain of unknown function (DUF4383)
MVTDTYRNYAQLYAQVLGWVLLIFGILGFFPLLGGSATQTGSDLFGLFAVNLLHNIVHLLTGVIGLFAGYYSGGEYARTYALVFGIVYTLLLILGIIVSPGMAINYGLGISFNLADNLEHLVIAAAGLAAYFATAPRTVSGPIA